MMPTLARCACNRLIVRGGDVRCKPCAAKLKKLSPNAPVVHCVRCSCGRAIRRKNAQRCSYCVRLGENRRKAALRRAIPKAQLTDYSLRFDPIRTRYQWAMAVGR